MDTMKYRILRAVHNSQTDRPVKSTDFYRKKRTINRNHQRIRDLIRSGLIRESSGSRILSITDKGLLALEAEEERRQDRCRDMIRYWITTGIALCALAISCIALAAQLGIIKLQ